MAKPHNPESVADADTRAEALDTGSSFIVQAPAGSGKTELLVRRFLALLSRVEKPESLLAITFTRKAASEMRERILKALEAADTAEAPGEPFERQRWALATAALQRSRDLGWDILENTSRLEVLTIDSLSARLAASMPLLSGFGMEAATRDEDAVKPLYREAVRRALALARNDQHLAKALATIIERTEARLERVEEQLVEMLSRREQWAKSALEARDGSDGDQRLMERIEDGFRRIMISHLEALTAALPTELAEQAGLLARATRNCLEDQGLEAEWPTLDSARDLNGNLAAVAAWKELRCLLLTKGSKGSLRKAGGINKRHGALPKSTEKQNYSKLLAEVADLDDADGGHFVGLLSAMTADDFPDTPELGSDGRSGLNAFLRVLLTAHGELWQIFGEQGLVDFSEVATRAVSALGDPQAPSDLLERLDRRIEHILVDEFQDTNIRQCDLVRKLSSGWVHGDGRTLFLVGDPMQSIYRFRKAEVGLFLRAANQQDLFEGIQLKPLALSVNFRCERRIIDWCNTHFAAAVGSTSDTGSGVVAYARSQPRPQAGPGDDVGLYLWQADEGGNDHDAEGQGLADLIADELLPAALGRGGKVAVLVRSRAQARPLMEALGRRGLKYSAGNMFALGDRAVVHDLRSLTRFILHPGDRLCGLALLRSPLAGLSLADLCDLVEPDVAEVRALQAEATDDGADIGTDAQAPVSYAMVDTLINDAQALGRISADGRQRSQRVAEVIKRSRALIGRAGMAAIVKAAWMELGGAVLADEDDLLDAEAYLGLVDQLSAAGTVSLEELDRRLEGLKATTSPDSDTGIEFLTMHGAKGLEFDTVVLPALGRGTQLGRDAPVNFETDPASGEMTIMAPAGARGRSSDDQRKSNLLKSREKIRDEAERLRLFYVASTRARQRLVLSAEALPEKQSPSPSATQPRRGSFLYCLWPTLQSEAGEPQTVSGGNGTDETADLQRIGLDFALPTPPQAVATAVALYRPSDTEADDDVHFTTSLLAPGIGTVVHSWLERIANEGLESWNSRRIHEDGDRIRRHLYGLGLSTQELDGAVEQAIAYLEATLADDNGRWVLTGHDQARCEWRLTSLDGEVFENASIDRTFIAEGRRWIVDYKTGRPDPGSTDSEFLEQRRDHYREQLQSYGHMLSQLEPGVPIELALYYPGLPALDHWPYQPLKKAG